MKLKFILVVLISTLSFMSCQKELSFDNAGTPATGGNIGGSAIYTLGDPGGNCGAAIVSGTYTAGTATSSSNTVELEVDVDSLGTYSVTTSTVNGISFAGSGTFDTTGIQSIILTAAGTPIAGGSSSFSAGTGSCSFSVIVTGGQTSSANCRDCQYYPSCVGAKYTYADTINGTAYNLVSELTASIDTTIGGTTFQKLTYSTTPPELAGNSTVYYNCSGGVTTMKAYNAVTLGGATVIESTIRPIKENAAVSETWADVNPYPGVPGVTYESRFSVAEKGISKTLGGVTYNDVIHIHLSSGTTTTGSYIEGVTTEYYYAKSIGMIEAVTTNVLLNQVVLHQVLKTYFIP